MKRFSEYLLVVTGAGLLHVGITGCTERTKVASECDAVHRADPGHEEINGSPGRGFEERWENDDVRALADSPEGAFGMPSVLARRAFVPPDDRALSSSAQWFQALAPERRQREVETMRGGKFARQAFPAATYPPLEGHKGTREMRIWYRDAAAPAYAMLRLWTSPRPNGELWDGKAFGEFYLYRNIPHHDRLPPEQLGEMFSCEDLKRNERFILCRADLADEDWSTLWKGLEAAKIAFLPGDIAPAFHGTTIHIQLGLAIGERTIEYNVWEGDDPEHEAARGIRAEVERLWHAAREPQVEEAGDRDPGQVPTSGAGKK